MRLLATPERKLGTQRIEDCFSPHFWHIEYISPHFYIAPVIVLYLAATCVSAFFSSHRFVMRFRSLGGFPPESSDVGRGSGEGREATLAGPVQPA